MSTAAQLVAAAIAGVTFASLAIGRVPRLRLNRASIALVGAGAVLVTGIVPFRDALHLIDLSTIFLLLSMMVINAVLELAGFFTWVGERVIERATSPLTLLVMVSFAAGLLSALFINDPVALMLTPLVCGVVLQLRLNPMPYLIALATSANIGSAATITGNPQNILIGTSSGIAYLKFLAHIGPISLLGLIVVIAVVYVLYRRDLTHPLARTTNDEPRDSMELRPAAERRIYAPVLRKSLLVVAGMTIAFFANVNVALAAYIAACALLFTRRIRSERILTLIDWPLLLLFFGLFIVTGALEYTGASAALFTALRPLTYGGTLPLTFVTTLLSNLISNVPAVLLFRPLVPQFVDPERTWLILAAASTLAGNLTLIGSVANLIVAEQARKMGIQLTFGEYLRAGAPITLFTLVIVVAML